MAGDAAGFLAPAVAAAALMVFLFTFTSFGVVQILGGPAFSTLEVEIYRQTAELLDLPTAAVLTLMQFAAVGAILAVHAWIVRRRETALKLVDPAQTSRRPRGTGEWALLGGVLGTVLLLILLPLGVLVERSLDGPGGYGFAFYRSLGEVDASGGTFLVPPWEAVRNSLLYALVATVFALVVGGLAAAALTRRAGRPRPGFRRAADAAARRLGRDGGLRFPDHTRQAAAGSAGLLDPRTARPGAGRRPLRRTDHAAGPAGGGRAAARGGGGSRRVPLRARREVDLPLVRRALLVAAGFAFAVSLGEFGATVFIARPDRPTLPVAVARLLGRPGELNYGQAMALSTVLMVVCAVSLLVLERIRTDRSGEF